MPHFTSAISDLRAIGPIVDLKIQPGSSVLKALDRAGQLHPDAISVTALIDTGASRTIMRSGIAGKFGVKPVGKRAINTSTSKRVVCYTYVMTLIFPSSKTLGTIAYNAPVIEAPMPSQKIDCLIGRDLLSHAVLVYIGPDNSFSMSL